MTLLPPPPASRRGRGASGLPDGYADQFEVILQILKDRTTRYDKPRFGGFSRPNTTPPDEVSHGHSHITAEGMRHDIYTWSQAVVEEELDVMKYRNPYAYRVIDDYFSVDSGHGDYDLLKQKAQQFPGSSGKTYQTLQMALYILVSRLMDYYLHCRPPAKVDTRTNRTITMQEEHAKILRVYDAWRKDLDPRGHPDKTAHVMARDNTALQCNCSTRTVQRVLKSQQGRTPDHLDQGDAA